MEKKLDKNKQYTEKEVKKMKRIVALFTILVFVLSSSLAFAADTTNVPTSLSLVITETTYYNAFGVATNGTSKTTRTLNSKRTAADGKESTQTSTTVSETSMSWRGGSLKADSVRSTTDSSGSDGSSSHSTGWVDYTYTSGGKLQSVTGGSQGYGDKGTDANGEALGTYTFSSVDTYAVKNGQAVLMKSVNTSEDYGPDGAHMNTVTTTTDNQVALIGGEWVVTQSTETTLTNHLTGNLEGKTDKTTRITTFTRDSLGKITGMSVTMPQDNNLNYRWVENGNGGAVQAFLTDYSATIGWDAANGFYVSKETVTFTANASTDGSGCADTSATTTTSDSNVSQSNSQTSSISQVNNQSASISQVGGGTASISQSNSQISISGSDININDLIKISGGNIALNNGTDRLSINNGNININDHLFITDGNVEIR